MSGRLRVGRRDVRIDTVGRRRELAVTGTSEPMYRTPFTSTSIGGRDRAIAIASNTMSRLLVP